MRHADFSIAAATPLAPTAATRPSPALDAGGGVGFGRVYSQLQGEIADFISHGEAGHAGAAALSPEGRLWHARSQGVVGAAAAAETPQANSPAQQEFLARIAPAAREAGARLGVAPELVAAHAALESGWGQRPLRQAEGGSSHNLFGVKAGPGWQGDVTQALTTEYEHGAALKKSEQFRSYPDQSSAFRDYAQVLLENPRYRAALGAGNDARAFAEGLARGGYATDPAYAAKLTRLATRLQGISE
jgi:flagellar protein FlgJ